MKNSDVIIPLTLNAALKAMANKNCRAIAGGTDILVKLHDCIDRPWPTLVVLDNIKALKKITASKRHIDIGASATFADIEKSKLLTKYAKPLVEAVSQAGSVQIRSRATIGGNIANGSPAGDTIPPLYAFDAMLEIRSANRKRWVPIADFFRGPGKTILAADELITKIRIPRPINPGFFLRLATRQALAISKVSVAACIKKHSGKVADIKIALGAVAPTVIRAIEAEKYLMGRTLDQAVIERAAEIASLESTPIDDIRSLAIYRKAMVGVLLKRGLLRFLDYADER